MAHEADQLEEAFGWIIAVALFLAAVIAAFSLMVYVGDATFDGGEHRDRRELLRPLQQPNADQVCVLTHIGC